MIVADTNVVSEPLKEHPDAQVLAWLAAHQAELAITAVTVGELRYGVCRLPVGKRRDRLADAVDALVAAAGDRVLGYDVAAANRGAELRAARRAAGHTVSVEDTMIAGICLAGSHALATRNVGDFADAGVVIHDPWA